MPFFNKSIILIALLCLLGNHAYAQRVIPDEKRLDYSCEQLSFRDVLFEISELTHVTIAWQEQILPGDSLVSLSVRNEPLGKLLDYLIQPHGLKYKIVGSQISIVPDRLADLARKFTISGYIRDSESGESLVSAHIYTLDQSRIGFSNEYGFFSLTLEKGIQRIYASYLGYERAIEEVFLVSDTIINLELKPSNYLREIVITESKLQPLPPSDRLIASVYDIPVRNIKYSLPLAGEPDVIRNVMASPGVSTGADGFGGMSVRGGAENQNLILFDGIPVYSSHHAFGLFSIFNNNVIKSARLYKGTIPAHYSGRLSSVMDIRTREGNYRKLAGNISLGLLTATASLEGPLVKEKSSFLISARRTFVDPWVGALTEALNERIDKKGRSDFYFYDLNGKFNWSLGRHSKIYLSYYKGQDFFENRISSLSEDDRFIFEDSDQLVWNTGNDLASLRWNLRLSQKLFLNTSVYRSRYEFNAFDLDRIELRDKMDDSFQSATFSASYSQSRIEDRAVRMEFDLVPNTRHSIKFGGAYVQHRFNPALILANESDSISSITEPVDKDELKAMVSEPQLNARELEFFFSDEIYFSPFTRINLGYNHMIVEAGDRRFSIPQPRVLFTTGSERYTFKASWGRMGQFLHSLVNTGLGVPVDVWLPSTDKLAPEKAWMVSTGHFINTRKSGTLGIELFYKQMDNITRYGQDGLIEISEGSNWEEQLPVGEGRSYGMEFSYLKNKGRTNIGMSYTLSWSDRRFDALNAGNYFRFRYDRRHVLNFSMVHRLNQDIDFAVNWQFASGAPVTIPSGERYFEYSEDGENPILVLVYDGINTSELPAYHRLDFGFNFRNTYDWGEALFTVGLYNSYNRQNTFYRDIVVDLTDPDNPVRYEDVTLLPVLPTISYRISF